MNAHNTEGYLFLRTSVGQPAHPIDPKSLAAGAGRGRLANIGIDIGIASPYGLGMALQGLIHLRRARRSCPSRYSFRRL